MVAGSSLKSISRRQPHLGPVVVKPGGDRSAALAPPAAASASASRAAALLLRPPPPDLHAQVPALEALAHLAHPRGPPHTQVRRRDPREVFADWLIDPKNPWFTQNIANRVWAWLVGRGIIHEPDDARPDNPPSNPKLLALLERELIASHYDLKQLYRLILNSKTYQLSSVPKADKPEGDVNFSHYPLRRLDAEVLIDALNKITGGTENYSSAIPEPFTYIPESQRSIALQDGSITSSFLELFGRSSRDTGLASERNNRPSADQRLCLLNSSLTQRKIEQSPMIKNLTVAGKEPRDIAIGMYLGILSRFPTNDELKVVEEYFKLSKAGQREAAVDVAWSLINSAEFLYRH